MPATIASPPLTARPLRCRSCGTERAAAPTAICEECLGPLDPVYEPGRPLPDRETIAGRAPSLWRYKEWLPFDGDPVWSLDTGFTPLVDAPALARRFGVARVWVKNDTVSHPSLSFKDRVVAAAINAAAAFGLDTIGCASTGNLANAVAAHAARAGLKAWIFIPDELEAGKVIGTSVYGARLVRVRGTYDDVNRLCAQLADRFGWGIANVNLRSYYGEGSKTVAYEIAEQLGWRLPTAVVAPMAGGSYRAGRRACTVRRRPDARRLSAWWSVAATRSSPRCRRPSAARSRSAIPRTARSPRGRCGRLVAGPRR